MEIYHYMYIIHTSYKIAPANGCRFGNDAFAR